MDVQSAIVLDLSGEWHCESPDGKVSRRVTLPGSSCENGIGKKTELPLRYTRAAMRAPREKYEYIGPLHYSRKVVIPKEFKGKDVTLFLERVNIASKLWIDGVEVDRGVIGLSTPHVYRLTDRVTKDGKPLFRDLTGEHEIEIMVDNSDLINLGNMASGYSVDTQGYWNGIIGKMELRADEKDNVESIQVYPQKGGIEVRVVTLSDRHVPLEIKKATLSFEVILPSGKPLLRKTEEIELYSKRQRNRTFIKIKPEDTCLWDEFEPSLYELKVTLNSGGKESFKSVRFGLRDVYVKDRCFMLNGHPLSLRGTINCAQYPETGYPPTDEIIWAKHFLKLRQFGMNHVRFHAWCPPEAAFKAADILGMYLLVEMPLWLNRDVTPMEFGDDSAHRLYFRDEALRISEAYGNHPSFMFFSNGNENLGDYALLETITTEMKAVDPRRLYTLTSNFDHPLSPAEDFMCAFEILHQKARIQFLHDEVAEGTFVNYDEMRKTVPVPFTSFEVGQYCVYPDVDIAEKYNKNMVPVNFDAAKKSMLRHGIYERLHDYIMASGDLAAKLYKEDIEAVLRTRGMGGFELLSLTDYTGQSTATVGILDVMYEEKGVISQAEWKGFCSETVPLLWAKREFMEGEHLTGFVSLYDYGPDPLEKPEYLIDFVNAKTGKSLRKTAVVAEGFKTPVDIPLDFVKGNVVIKVYITVYKGEERYTNSWRIFVYKENKPDYELIAERTVKNGEEFKKAAKAGGRYLITPRFFEKDKTVKSSFIPVFWSPVHFPSEASVGMMIDEKHDLLKHFPTEKYTDYQWKKPVEGSYGIRINEMVEKVDPVLEFVPNFDDNEPKSPLFTFKTGKAEFIYCGFDAKLSDPASKALFFSVGEYLKNS